MNKYKFIIYMVVIFIIFFTGCANTLKYQLESTSRDTMTDGSRTTIASLSLDLKDYDVYYSGVNYVRAKGILFDPKNDGIKLVPEGKTWTKVNDRGTFGRLVRWIAGPYEVEGGLLRILSPKNRLVGYLYLRHNDAYAGARIVDESTIIFLPIQESRPRSSSR